MPSRVSQVEGASWPFPQHSLRLVWGLTFHSSGAEVDLFSLVWTTLCFLSSVIFPGGRVYIFEHLLSADQFISLSTSSMSGTKMVFPCF